MSRSLTLTAVLVAVLTVVAVAGCGGAAGTGPGGATSTAGVASASGQSLAGLDPARLPDTSAAVAALLARMPATVVGHTRTNSTTGEVHYADGSAFSIAPRSGVDAASPAAADEIGRWVRGRSTPRAAPRREPMPTRPGGPSAEAAMASVELGSARRTTSVRRPESSARCHDDGRSQQPWAVRSASISERS